MSSVSLHIRDSFQYSKSRSAQSCNILVVSDFQGLKTELALSKPITFLFFLASSFILALITFRLAINDYSKGIDFTSRSSNLLFGTKGYKKLSASLL